MRKINNKTPNIIIIAGMVLVVLRGAAGAEEEWANDNTPHLNKRSLEDRMGKKGWGVLILLSMNMGLKPRFCEPERPWLHFSISKPLIWVPLSAGLAVTFTSWQVLRKIQQSWKFYSSHKALCLHACLSLALFPRWLLRVLSFIPHLIQESVMNKFPVYIKGTNRK